MVKSLEYFQSNNCLLSELFYCFCQILFNLGLVRFSASWKKLSSCFFLRVILITYSITLCLEKEIIVLEKGLEKICTNPVWYISHDTIRHCNLAFIRLRNFEATLFPSFWFLSSTSNLCLFEEVLFTGFESQDVTCLPMIAQASTLDFQQTYNYYTYETPFSLGVIFAQAHLFR